MRRSTCMLFSWGMLATVLLVALPDAVQGQTAIAKSGSTSVRAVLERKTANVTIQTVTIEDSSNAFPSIDWGVKAITPCQDATNFSRREHGVRSQIGVRRFAGSEAGVCAV